jgi:chromosome segregation ATPase
MKALERKLLDIKSELDDKVTAKTRMEGQLQSALNTVLELSGCKAIGAAKKELSKRQVSLSKKEKQLRDEVKELEQDFYELVPDN